MSCRCTCRNFMLDLKCIPLRIFIIASWYIIQCAVVPEAEGNHTLICFIYDGIMHVLLQSDTNYAKKKKLRQVFFKNYPKPEAWKTVFACVYISAVYTTQTKTNELWHILCGYIYISVYTKCITFILSWSNQQFQWLREPGRDGIHYMTFSIIHHKRAPSCFCLFRCLGQTQLDSSHWLTSTAIKLWRLESSRLLTYHTHPPATFAHVWSGWSINWRWWSGGFT